MALTIGEKLYLNEEVKDVVFLVRSNGDHYVRFPALKLVLSLASPVFSVMFNENFKEGETGRVTITDVMPSAFACLLQFAHIGGFDTPTVAVCKDVMYAADKYLMPDLTKFCFAQLENVEVNFESFWNFFYIVCSFYSEIIPPKMVKDTLTYLDENAENILSSDEWTNLNSSGICKILKRSSLKRVSETKILNRVLQWSKMECCRQNVDVNADSETKILENIKFEIRYLLIPREKLLHDITKCSFLTQTEKILILEDSLQGTDSLPLPWNNSLLTEPRGKSKTLRLCLEDVIAKTVIETSTKCLLLVISQDCTLEELVICVQAQGEGVIRINGEITDLDGNVYDTWVVNDTISREKTITIAKPICLKKYKAYMCDLVCVNGSLIEKYTGQGFSDEASSGVSYIFVADFPNDYTNSDDFKSNEFWEKIMGSQHKDDDFYNFAHNSVVKAVTISI